MVWLLVPCAYLHSSFSRFFIHLLTFLSYISSLTVLKHFIRAWFTYLISSFSSLKSLTMLSPPLSWFIAWDTVFLICRSSLMPPTCQLSSLSVASLHPNWWYGWFVTHGLSGLMNVVQSLTLFYIRWWISSLNVFLHLSCVLISEVTNIFSKAQPPKPNLSKDEREKIRAMAKRDDIIM